MARPRFLCLDGRDRPVAMAGQEMDLPTFQTGGGHRDEFWRYVLWM